jgi:hypothetical protein
METVSFHNPKVFSAFEQSPRTLRQNSAKHLSNCANPNWNDK